jgi:hypothetical protein
MANDWRDKYDYVYGFYEGLAKVKLNGKYGYVDKTGNEVVPPKYQWVEPFHEGLAQVKLNSKWGLVDKKGNEYWDMAADQAREQMKKR